MTNVINTASNSSISPNLHNSVVSQQSEDHLPSSLSFNVTSADGAEHSTISGSGSVTHRSNPMNNDVSSSPQLSESSISLLNPLLNNNTVDNKDKKFELNDSPGNSATELLTVRTSPAGNNGASISPALSTPSQVTLTAFDYSSNSDESPVVSMWSSVDDGNNHNLASISSNGFKTSPVGVGGGGYPNPNAPLLNNTNKFRMGK